MGNSPHPGLLQPGQGVGGPEAPLSGRSWILSASGTHQGEEGAPASNNLPKPAWHRSKARHLLGWWALPALLLSGIPLELCPGIPWQRAWQALEHLEG